MKSPRRILLSRFILLLLALAMASCGNATSVETQLQAAGTTIIEGSFGTPTPHASAVPAVTATGISLPLVQTPATPSPAPLPTPAPSATAESTGPRLYSYEVIASYPHDPQAFTQGLVYLDGVLYEGTGLYGRSSLRRVDLATGEVLQQIELEPQYFGEGIAIFDEQIYQLTWRENAAFVYDQSSFTRTAVFTSTTEGWGLTHDGSRLIMSDGTPIIRFRDPATFAEIGRIEVRDPNGPVRNLNELEYINGLIYANVWQSDRIVQIDPASGAVVGEIDLSGLLPPEDRRQPVDVLNGIAYDAANERLFVTGKLWPKLFEIRLLPLEN
jgi:glutaminyl-peptide cyclotransferase